METQNITFKVNSKEVVLTSEAQQLLYNLQYGKGIYNEGETIRSVIEGLAEIGGAMEPEEARAMLDAMHYLTTVKQMFEKFAGPYNPNES